MTTKEHPDFAPKLTPHDGLHRYEDGRVIGVVGLHDKVTVIYEWSSLTKGAGNTKEALKWLRAQGAEQIIACNVGMPVEPGQAVESHTAYWIHMKHSGLVDTLVDDDGYYFPVSDPVASPSVKRRHAEADSGPGF